MNPTTRQINYLNIGLMILSCLLAFVYPFELFLFSYAVLGPLHYLTEISWLHERKYFTEQNLRKASGAHRWWLILVGVTMAAILFGFLAAEGAGTRIAPIWEITLFYSVFVSAAVVSAVKDRSRRIAVCVVSVLLLVLFSISGRYVVGAFFLVTIIHVLIFTGAFVFHGALRERSVSGMLSFAVFVICVASFFLFSPPGHTAGAFAQQSYRSFNALNAELLKLFRLGSGTSGAEVYESVRGLMVMRLIAFAYTYHYLNWFSKTSIIRWHQVPRRRTAMMLILWIASVGLYAYDYDRGMAVLYFLSILHVMLEFPLNHLTFVGIAKELSGLRLKRATESA